MDEVDDLIMGLIIVFIPISLIVLAVYKMSKSLCDPFEFALAFLFSIFIPVLVLHIIAYIDP